MQRFTPQFPCPVCKGHKEMPQGQGIRCAGFQSADGYAHCTREEHAGPIAPDKDGISYAHRLGDAGCKCGTTHGESSANPEQQYDRKRPKWRAITPVPANAPEPTFKHYKHGSANAGTWAYRNAAGELLGYRVRFDFEDGGKDVLPYSWCVDENPNTGYVDSWQWKDHAVPRPLYRLDALAAKPDADVLLVEGEGKADVAAFLYPHLAVISCSGGSNGPKHSDFTPVAGRRVINWRDNDGEGLKHVALCAGPLKLAKVAEYRVVQVPAELPVKWDLGDSFPAGFTLDDARKLIEEAPLYEQPKPLAIPEATKPAYHMTEGGNAQRLVDKFGQDIRYSPARKWMSWDGRRWAVDGAGHVQEAAKSVVRMLYEEADTAQAAAWDIGGPKHPEAEDAHRYARELTQHAKHSDKSTAIKGMTDLSCSDPAIRIDAEDLDGNNPANGDSHRLKWILNVANGTIDLRTGELLPHDRADLLTKMAPIAYDPEAKCPTWERFLSEIMGGDGDVVGFMQRGIGYCLTGSTRDQVYFLCYGQGSNGKTVMLETLGKLLGEYVKETPASTLMVKKFDNGGTEDLARLAGARLVTANESEDGERLAEARIKAITGGDTIVARFLFQGSFSYRPQFKLWIRTNHKPTIRGTDEGIWRRTRLIPFTQTFSGERKDSSLPAKLEAELPGILAWAVRGCLEWQRIGLQEPEAVLAATSEYRDDMDGFGRFLAQLEIESPTPATNLHEAYVAYCTENAEPEMSLTKFGKRLTEAGWVKTRNRKGQTLRVPPSQAAAYVIQGDEQLQITLPNYSSLEPALPADDEGTEQFVGLPNILSENIEKRLERLGDETQNGSSSQSLTQAYMRGESPTNPTNCSSPDLEPAPPQAPNSLSDGPKMMNGSANCSSSPDGPLGSQNLTPTPSPIVTFEEF